MCPYLRKASFAKTRDSQKRGCAVSAPKLLQRINRDGNAFPYETELVEDWTPDGDRKDCDSYASWKFLECLEAGISDEVMDIATCWTETRGYHAVLLVYVEGKVWVLDNRFYWVEPIQFFQKRGYDFDIVAQFMQDWINE